MTERPNFFYKETQGKRLDLRDDFTNALLGDVSPSLLPQTRKTS